MNLEKIAHLSPALLLLAVACGSVTPSASPDGSGGDPPLSSTGGSIATGGSDGGGGGTADVPSYTPVPVKRCVDACSTAADSASEALSHAEANYSCEQGACRWLGCVIDTDCQHFAAPDDICAPDGLCSSPCSTAEDCAKRGVGSAHDANNYECTDGRCKYIACLSDEECVNSFADSRYTCRPNRVGGAPGCYTGGCSSDADCRQTNNSFACIESNCLFVGCQEDADCSPGRLCVGE